MRGIDVVSINDALLAPIFIFFILFISRLIQRRNIEKYPEYKYYLPGLMLKLVGGMGVCFIYTYYYVGGDTIAYFHDCVVMSNLLFESPQYFAQLFFNGGGVQNNYMFSSSTGYPILIYDNYAFFVVRFTCLLSVIGFKSFFVTTILLAWISFGGLWRLYRLFVSEFPHLQQKLALGFFFIPSLFFWGSGLLKDTITTSFMSYFVSSFYFVFIKKEKKFSNLLLLAFSTFIILSIKPYIFIGLLPGTMMWLISDLLSKVRGAILKVAILPIFLILLFGFGFMLLNMLGQSLGQYNIDYILVKASETQKDLKRDAYMGNSFDIGTIEPTFSSMISHAHLAIFAAIFRPSIIEVNNIVMFASALENTFMLYITIVILWKLRFFGIFKYFLGTNNLLTFALSFSLFFAFSVGLTTSNFGSLVRYKIPLIPFYVSSIYIIRDYIEREKAKQVKKEEFVYGFR